jgi:hypothetical protein
VRRHAGAASAGSIDHRGRHFGAGFLATLALSAALLLGIGAPVASAAPEAGPGWAYKANFGGFEYFGFDTFRTPVAVDGSGNIFGSDENQGVVRIYSPSPDGGTLLAEASAGARNIAVDPSDGSIYADGLFSSPVRRFVSDGAPTPTYTLDPAFGEIPGGEGLAVDPATGDLLVADSGAEGVRRYDTSGTLLETIATPSLNPAWIVAAPDGSFYVAPSGGPDVTHFSGAGALLGTISGVGSLHGLAYDASRSLVVVAVGEELQAYSPAGALLAKSPAQGGGGIGLAVGPSGSLYEHVGGSLNFYAPGTVPGVEAPQVSAIAVTSAHASAEVDPGAGPPEGSVAHFEVSADGGLTWPDELKTPDVSIERTETEGPDTVEAALAGLKGNTDYLVRLVAANSVISTTSGATPFHTPLGPPEVETGPAISIAETAAELTGSIDTLGDQTTFHFEYGLTIAYGTSVPAGAEGIAGNEGGFRSFARGISGLQPNTVYHYRLVARNSAGEEVGLDRTFTTAGAEPARVYERVSPAEKMGGVINPTYGFQVAADGSAISYQLTAAPANAESAAIFSQMLSRRASGGWLDWQQIDPPQNNAFSITEGVTHAISSDFSQAMVVSNRVLTPVDPLKGPFEGAGNIYIRDLSTGTYTFVGSAPGAYPGMTAVAGRKIMYLAGAPDFSWIIFAPPSPLAGSGTSASALYKWSRQGGLEVESRLPGTDEIATGSVRRPESEPWTVRMASDDGETVYFSLLDGEGGVYRREGGETKAISVSDRQGEDSTIVHGGFLHGASSDGRYAFFRTETALTDDTPLAEPGPYIYRYDASDDHLDFVTGSLVSGVGLQASGNTWGVGDDGSTVYFWRYSNEGSEINSFAWRSGATHRVTQTALENIDHFTSPNSRFMAYRESDGSVHLYDAVEEESVCVSCSGFGDKGRMSLPNRQVSNREPEVVNDEGVMYFDSTNPLVAEDRNATQDVYQYDRGRLTLISPGDGPYVAHFGDVTPDGSDVFFTTNEPLAAGDTDGAIDVYDARIGGGFPAEAAVRPPCEGESCRSPIGAPPPLPAGKPGGNATARFAIGKVQALTAADRRSLATGGKARLRLTVSRPGDVSLTGRAKIGGAQKKVVGASAKAKAAGAIAIPFALSKVALSQLNKKGSLAITLRVGFGDAKPRAVHFTLKAAAKKKGGRS